MRSNDIAQRTPKAVRWSEWLGRAERCRLLYETLLEHIKDLDESTSPIYGGLLLGTIYEGIAELNLVAFMLERKGLKRS